MSLVLKVNVQSFTLHNCYIVNITNLNAIGVYSMFVFHMVLCDKVLPRSPTNKVGEDVTESVRTCANVGNLFK